MPKNKFQNVIFTMIMAFLMVYAMICFNIALDKGGMSNSIFLIAFHELLLMWPVAILLELFVVERLASQLAFRIISPDDKPIFILLAISAMIVCLMCPMMSMVATILFKNPGKELVAVWLETTLINFPMALGWQIFVAGPLGRWMFRSIFFASEPIKQQNI
ncbi:DUF2798 domain-containing protein [Anaerobium acetethylicum]|uniref:DUF2798 domain-containing protein n=1 Tax=Anaerobium acetethylicum TaxID=1619234 RepID=A0A1D3TYF6_9FIRM|nr:DUF2798 domain-containing protein [Anaerobium acetethylicum]SCP99492.1 hypothetical protein SAMN05421730_104313 [Anaerobium acetethylicum]